MVIVTTNGTCTIYTMYTILIQNGNYADNYERDTLEGRDIASLAEYFADNEELNPIVVGIYINSEESDDVSVSQATLLKFEDALAIEISEDIEGCASDREHNRLESMR